MSQLERKSNFANWGVTLVTAGLACVGAHVVIADRWPIFFCLLVAVPALACLRKYPLLALIIWLGLAPFLMYTPTSAGRMVFWIVHRALPPVAVGLVILNAAGSRRDGRPLPKIGIAELAMACYLVISLISIQVLSDRPRAISYLFYDRVFSPMCLYLLVRLSAPSEKDLRRMLPVLLFLCVSQSLICLASWTAPSLLPEAWINPTRLGRRGVGSLSSPSVYTTAVIFAGLLVFHTAVNRKRDFIRTACIGACGLSLVGVFFSFSRASWLAGLMVVGGLGAAYPKTMIRLSGVGIAIILVGGMFGGGILASQSRSAHERLASDRSQEAAMSRLPVAFASLRMFANKPLFGWGYENHNRFDWQFQEAVAGYSPTKDHSSHNVYLTLLAEQGMIGSGLFLAPVILCLASSWSALKRLPENGFWSKKLLFVLWLMIFGHLIVNNFSNMRVPFGLGLWWLTVGLIANLAANNDSTHPEVIIGPYPQRLTGGTAS